MSNKFSKIFVLFIYFNNFWDIYQQNILKNIYREQEKKTSHKGKFTVIAGITNVFGEDHTNQTRR